MLLGDVFSQLFAPQVQRQEFFCEEIVPYWANDNLKYISTLKSGL